MPYPVKRTKYTKSQLTCKECGFVFTRMDSLKIHLKRHQSVNEYSCNICDKFSFPRKIELKYHIRDYHLKEIASLKGVHSRKIQKLTKEELEKIQKIDKVEEVEKPLLKARKAPTIHLNNSKMVPNFNKYMLEELIKLF